MGLHCSIISILELLNTQQGVVGGGETNCTIEQEITDEREIKKWERRHHISHGDYASCRCCKVHMWERTAILNAGDMHTSGSSMGSLHASGMSAKWKLHRRKALPGSTFIYGVVQLLMGIHAHLYRAVLLSTVIHAIIHWEDRLHTFLWTEWEVPM